MGKVYCLLVILSVTLLISAKRNLSIDKMIASKKIFTIKEVCFCIDRVIVRNRTVEMFNIFPSMICHERTLSFQKFTQKKAVSILSISVNTEGVTG